MSDLVDGFIALPGGLGTLEELAEVASWAPLELHAKPIGLLGRDGYWEPLLAWLDHAVGEGFIAPRHRRLIARDADLHALLARFEAWQAPRDRWGRDTAALRVGAPVPGTRARVRRCPDTCPGTRRLESSPSCRFQPGWSTGHEPVRSTNHTGTAAESGRDSS